MAVLCVVIRFSVWSLLFLLILKELSTMKTFMLLTGSGPLMILTSHTSIEDPKLLQILAAKGIEKFLAYEVPGGLAEKRYGGHFSVVANNLHETDDLRVLDYNGERIFKLFSFKELAEPIGHEPSGKPVTEVA
jgi:hypothetical protein